MDREEVLAIVKKNHQLMLDLESKAPADGHRAKIESAAPGCDCFVVDNTEWLRVGRIYKWLSAEGVSRGSVKIARKGIDRLNNTPYIDPEYGLGKVPPDAAAGDVLSKGDDVTGGTAAIHRADGSVEVIRLDAE